MSLWEPFSFKPLNIAKFLVILDSKGASRMLRMLKIKLLQRKVKKKKKKKRKTVEVASLVRLQKQPR